MKYKVNDSFNTCCDKVYKLLLQFSPNVLIHDEYFDVLEVKFYIFGEKVVTVHQSNPYGECEIEFEGGYFPQEHIDEWLKDTYGFYEVLHD